MSASETPKSVVARPAALIVESDASFREALREAADGHDVIEALRQVLASRGYDVLVSTCQEGARRLVQERSFDKIYSDGTLPVSQSSLQTPAGPRIEDWGDGTARVQLDEVVPWSAALELMDVLSGYLSDKPRRLS